MPMLISRFILNLRQVPDSESDPSPSRSSGIASVVFRIQERIVGNMGESLDYGFGGETAEGDGEEGDFIDECINDTNRDEVQNH